MAFLSKSSTTDHGGPVGGLRLSPGRFLVGCDGCFRYSLGIFVSRVVLLNGMPLLVGKVVIKPSEPSFECGHLRAGGRLPWRRLGRRRRT